MNSKIKNYVTDTQGKALDLSVINDFKSSVCNCSNLAILPGFCDVHVHFREPGFSYKETIKTGSLSAARGGFTAVCTMPNLNPVPDSVENLKVQTDIIKKNAVISVYPYASITVGQKGQELSDLDALSDKVIGFSDDGKGVQDEKMISLAMQKTKELNKILVCHCEDDSLLNGGYIHLGEYAKTHGHRGICSESEYKMIERDVELLSKYDCAYHVCHVSTKESVEIIRKAKEKGLNVTCETAPHYLILDDLDLQEDGRFKMNPPIRSKSDKQALIEGVLDGTIDMIATDHAPHSKEEKGRGLEKSVFGVVGLETSFPAMYTYFVKTGIMSMEHLVILMAYNPAKRFGIDITGDYSIWDLDKEFIVDSTDFLSMGKATPFEGMKMFGENLLTVKNGKVVYKK
ncbi:MAG: dihydroorotase [Clostridia bacterium]|nr:dihydroorotase [Clostridia bacterium]